MMTRAAISEIEHRDLRIPTAVGSRLPGQPDGIGRSAKVLCVNGKTVLLFFNEALAVALGLRVIVCVAGEADIEDNVAIVVALGIAPGRNQHSCRKCKR